MRQATLAELTYLVNHPRIAPAFGLQTGQRCDMTGVVENKLNISLWCPLGAAIFAYESPGTYEGHYLFLPGNPGKEIKRYATQMIGEMFTKYGVRVINGRTPRDNRAARVMSVALGFLKVPNSEFTDGFGRRCDVYQVRRDRWVTYSASVQA